MAQPGAEGAAPLSARKKRDNEKEKKEKKRKREKEKVKSKKDRGIRKWEEASRDVKICDLAI